MSLAPVLQTLPLILLGLRVTPPSPALALASLAVLVVLAGLGLGAFVYQYWNPAGDRRLLVPSAFAGAAATFLLLYEAWMREEACGGQAEGGLGADEVRGRVLPIYRMQLALVLGLLLAANILAGLDWTQHPNTGVFVSLTGALLGVIGCAQALASGYTGKRYQTRA